MAVAREAADVRAVPPHHQPIAVMLDPINPERAGRWPRRLRRQTRFDEAGGTPNDHRRRMGQRATGSTAPVKAAAYRCAIDCLEGAERLTSNAPHWPPLVTHQPLHIASFGAVWSIYPQCYLMSGCCLVGLGWLPVVPSLAFVVVSLVLADHWAGGSLNVE